MYQRVMMSGEIPRREDARAGCARETGVITLTGGPTEQDPLTSVWSSLDTSLETVLQEDAPNWCTGILVYMTRRVIRVFNIPPLSEKVIFSETDEMCPHQMKSRTWRSQMLNTNKSHKWSQEWQDSRTSSLFLLIVAVFLWFIPKLQLQCEDRTSGGPVTDSMLPLQGVWVQSLGRELRSLHAVRWPKNLINQCKNIRGAGDPSCAWSRRRVPGQLCPCWLDGWNHVSSLSNWDFSLGINFFV